jgi:hypothetical protein
MDAFALAALAFMVLDGVPLRAGTPGVRNAHALAYDADRARVLLFGGADDTSVRGDLWEWDGGTWRLIASGGPPPRTFPALAYDRARQRLVLFGGNRVLFGTDASRDTFLDDVWEWYEGAWHQVRVASPPARAEASMAYDAARRRLVLFGGYHTTGAGRVRLGDTWEWDGSRWERKSPPIGPSPRNGAAMTYDSDRGRIVLFGGSGGPSGETWEWDGGVWQRVEAPAPGRFNSAMAYDAARKAVLRFGGWNGKAREGDTWRYDGIRWDRLAAEGPAARNHTALVYDERRQVLVLFGGHDGERVFGDTWEWRDAAWSRVAIEAARVRVDNGH